jgi:uncharacterized protein
MELFSTNKRKIINDPVFGFINIQSEVVFDIIEHRYFQRLRRIRQLGLSSLVYPGANHTRFEHALGCVHLMRSAIDVLRSKGVEITNDEADAVTIAILVHDIGHGPFSHALEFTLVSGITHEKMSLLLMEELNLEMENQLSLAIRIFKNEYHKKFLYQLVSGQLDIDRLDYLRRDSFYSGVVEGTIGSDRIIKMLNVANDQLVVDKKGIYSVEKFLIARRLMYWQVYLHKTVLSAEYLLINILKRAKHISLQGENIFGPPQLQWLLLHQYSEENLKNNDYKSTLIENFVHLDDSDIFSSIKVWCNHTDRVLSILSTALINRKLYKVKISDMPISNETIEKYLQKASLKYSIPVNDAHYLVFQDTISNSAYMSETENINILFNNGETADLKDASDIELSVLTRTVKKHFFCYPKGLDLD